jgi:hypothetical protein
MDGISAAASVIAVIEGALATLQYAKDVAHSDHDRRRLASEAASLRSLLEVLQKVVTQARDRNGALSVGVNSLGEPYGLLSQISETVDYFVEKLSLGKDKDSTWYRMAKALKWPLDKRSCSEIVSKIERLGVSMIALLQADSLYRTPNDRCSYSERLSFPLTTSPARLHTRSRRTQQPFSHFPIARLRYRKTCRKWFWIRVVSFWLLALPTDLLTGR